jgi:hypothetical protein|tara:strand:+ start:293 stop:532 length:240 start_codon:yes stop_codon:yes gene_type:complete
VFTRLVGPGVQDQKTANAVIDNAQCSDAIATSGNRFYLSVGTQARKLFFEYYRVLWGVKNSQNDAYPDSIQSLIFLIIR